MKKALILSILLVFVIGGCKKQKKAEPSRKTVVTSIAPLASIARAVGGSNFDYRYIVPRSANPHTFEPTPGDMKAVQNSSIFIYIGLRLDPWAQKMADYARIRLAVGDSLKACNLPVENPHNIWLCPNHVKAVADIIGSALEELSPEFRDSIELNMERFSERVDSLEKWAKRFRVDTIKVMVYHGAWAGVLKEFGFQVVDVITENPAQEPSLNRINRVIESAKKQGVSVVVAESNFPLRVPRKVAEAIGAKLVVANPLYGGDYVDTMRKLLEDILGQ